MRPSSRQRDGGLFLFDDCPAHEQQGWFFCHFPINSPENRKDLLKPHCFWRWFKKAPMSLVIRIEGQKEASLSGGVRMSHEQNKEHAFDAYCSEW